MKILVATKETQGNRKNDFCFCDEEEIVKAGMECDGESVDGSCGCRRSMCGVTTQKATTTMKVIDSSLTQNDVEQAVYDSLKGGGWLTGMTETKAKKWAKDDTQELLRIANVFRVGDIVEKRGNKFQTRNPIISVSMGPR